MACIFSYFCWADSYQFGAHVKYDRSAEYLKRILITGDVENFSDYCQEWYGATCNPKTDLQTTISDERPIFFTYLAIMKFFFDDYVEMHMILSFILLAMALVFLGYTLIPREKLPLFIALSPVLLSPYMSYQAFMPEPSVMEAAITAFAVILYLRKKFFWAFFLLGISIGFHPGNMVLTGCLGLFFLFEQRKAYRLAILGVLGGGAGFLLNDLVIGLWFLADDLEALPREFLVERFLLSASERTTGSFATSDSLLGFLRNSILFLPLATIGVIWVKERHQMIICLMPMLLYLVITDFHMPAVYRVLLPIYLMAGVWFLVCFLVSTSRIERLLRGGLIVLAALWTLLYHGLVAATPNLAKTTAIAVGGIDGPSPPPQIEEARLYWNLRRHNTIDASAPVKIYLRTSSLDQEQTIPTPPFITGYVIFSTLFYILPDGLAATMQQKLTAGKPALQVVEERIGLDSPQEGSEN